MQPDEFVESIKEAVWKSAVKSVEANLIDPPGRFPQKNWVDMSNWYKSLASDDKKMLLQVLDKTAFMAVFGFLCVLDNVRTIEEYGPKGEFKLYFEKNGEKSLLTIPNDPLHEML